MKRTLYTIAFGITLAGLGIAVPELCTGCREYRPPEVPAYCKDERAYTGALVLCVEKAETLEQSKACRIEVNKTCGITEVVTGGRP